MTMRRILPLLACCFCTCFVDAQFGVLDPGFGGDGIVQTAVGDASLAQAVAVQPDGKILVAGSSTDSTAVIVRYLIDGSLDGGFGSGGIVILDAQELAAIGDLILQPDGKILICGRVSTAPWSDFLLARYNPDGTLDTGFGFAGTGLVFVSFAPNLGTAVKLVLQPDGKILLAGWLYSPSPGVRIMRFTDDGLTDNATFGTGGGVSIYSIAGALTIDVRGMALQDDGGILITGTAADGSNTNRYVARMLDDGSVDVGFGSAGSAILDAGISATERASDVVLQDDGAILAVGYVSTGVGDQHPHVTRLLVDGTVDASYGTGGEAMGPVVGGDIFTQQGIVQGDGKLVFDGHYNDGAQHGGVWRVNTDGTFDPTFGTAGAVIDPFGAGFALLFDVAEQTDGKLLICGQGAGASALTTARLTSGQDVGIDEHADQPELAIFPNPVEDRLNFASSKAGELRILDATGRVVMRATTNASMPLVIDVHELAPGPYNVVQQGTGNPSARFIKH